MIPRYTVRNDGPDRYGVEYWSIIDTRDSRVRATWTVVAYAYDQCNWLNANAADKTW